MPRSPLTLAASVTAALPDAVVVGAGRLGSADAAGVAAALVDLADGRRVVVRVAADDEAGRAVRAEARVLATLSAGVRSLLPFALPTVLGEAPLADGLAIVTDYQPGYRVDAADLPPGAGFTGLVGRAISAVHDLPVTVIRAEGYPVRSASQVRADAARIVDRADATGVLSAPLRDRWRTLLEDDAAWRYESTVVLDGLEVSSLVFDDDADGVPEVVAVLGWQGLSVGDPAVDLRWLGSAPDAVDGVHAGYVDASHRGADPALIARARLFAELEFAKWLLHGIEQGDDAVVADATALLSSLTEATAGTDLVRTVGGDVDDAIALLARVPDTTSAAGDTSMQTDAYDPVELGAYLAEDRAESSPDSAAIPTLPVDLSEWTVPPLQAESETAGTADDDEESREEAQRASREALRRWTEG